MNGQCIKQQFSLIRFNPNQVVTGIAVGETQDCCFILPALAEETFTDKIKNDFHSPIFFYSDAFIIAKLYLQKYNGVDYDDITELTDNTYGTNYPFGFFKGIYGENCIGYTIEWAKVLFEEGEGDYRIKSEATPLIGNDPVKNYSFEFCLKKYTDQRSDHTIRFEWYKNGNSGSIADQTRKLDYGTLNWFNQIRLPSAAFGFDEGTYEREYVKYQNGQKVWLEDSQVEEYTLKIGRIPNYLHKFLKVDVLQSDRLMITDYNQGNPTSHINTEIIPSSNWQPKWEFYTQLAPVELKFQQAIQNFTNKRS